MTSKKTKDDTDKPLSVAQTLGAIGKVVRLSFSISPLAIVFKLLSGVFDSLLPLATAFLAAQTLNSISAAFNGVDGAQQRTLLLITLTAGAGLLTGLKSTILSYVDQIVRFKVEARVSDMLYERFTQLEFWRYDDKDSTDLYEKARDFAAFFVYVFDRAAQLFTSLFGLVSALLALASVSPWLSLALLIAVMPGMFVQYKISRFQVRHWRENVTARRKQWFIERNMMHPTHISELRLYNLAKTMLSLRKKFRDQDQGARLSFERKYIKWRVVGDIFESIAQLGSLAWVVVRIANRTLPIGQFVFVQQLVSTALSSANRFVSEYGAADEDLAKLKDYTEFMSLPLGDLGTSKLPAQIQTIEFKNVSFSYPKTDTQVLTNVNMKIETGSHIAIVGENGAGKSTLIKLLLGFYKPTSGDIYINGVSLSQYSSADWHRKVGVLLQDFNRFDFANAKENIVFGDVDRPVTQKGLDESLQQAEAKEMIDKLPKGLETPMATWYDEEGGTSLSGGQWQRLALARNFYRKAPIVILDEPTSAIDALAEAKIFDRLFDKKNKNTLIAVSHRLTTIESADRIYVLKDGKVAQEGSHDELAGAPNGEYVHMFKRQLKKQG